MQVDKEDVSTANPAPPLEIENVIISNRHQKLVPRLRPIEPIDESVFLSFKFLFFLT
jgi:hypothetical protein